MQTKSLLFSFSLLFLLLCCCDHSSSTSVVKVLFLDCNEQGETAIRQILDDWRAKVEREEQQQNELSRLVVESVCSSPVLLNNTLTIPKKTTLSGMSYKASSDFVVPAPLLSLESHTTLSKVEGDGSLLAQHIVVANSAEVEDITISDCELHSTNNNLYGVAFTGTYIHNDIIYFNGMKDVSIRNSALVSAGMAVPNGKENPSLWSSVGTGVLCYNCKNLVVSGNLVNQTSTAGIDITGSLNVEVSNNRLDFISRNIEWWDNSTSQPPLGDFITGYDNFNYHTYTQSESFNWTISGNVGTNGGNHGIHVSGTGITIENNVITFVNQGGLFLGDQDDPNECVSQIETKDMYIRYSNMTHYLYRSPERSSLPAYDLNDVFVQGYEYNGESLQSTITFSNLDITPGESVVWGSGDDATCQRLD